MAAILKGKVGSLAGEFGHCLGRNSETAEELIKIAITFDVLDRFEENKVFQTAQTMNYICEVKYKMVALSPWKP